MTKKDYEAAARIVQGVATRTGTQRDAYVVREAFAQLFAADSSRFDRGRFYKACVPAANVRARKPTTPTFPPEDSEKG